MQFGGLNWKCSIAFVALSGLSSQLWKGRFENLDREEWRKFQAGLVYTFD
jgi:hypothetical protein